MTAPLDRLSPGKLAQVACLLEVTARKPGNVHRFRDFADTTYLDFLLSATAIVEPLDRAQSIGVGAAILEAVAATRLLVATNTNLGMILLLAPLAAVADAEFSLRRGVAEVLEATTVRDAALVYQAIRLARPGGLGQSAQQDVADEPTMPLRAVMRLAADRDLIARQYANGYAEVFDLALPALHDSLRAGHPLETGIVALFLALLAEHPDTLIARKLGGEVAAEASSRAQAVLSAGWPEPPGLLALETFDDWLRADGHARNPGATADLTAAALFAALRDGTIPLPLPPT